jgi:hypothetical protein
MPTYIPTLLRFTYAINCYLQVCVGELILFVDDAYDLSARMFKPRLAFRGPLGSHFKELQGFLELIKVIKNPIFDNKPKIEPPKKVVCAFEEDCWQICTSTNTTYMSEMPRVLRF